MPAIPSWFAVACWSLSQLLRGARRLPPWIGGQPIAGLAQKDRQTFTVALTPTLNFDWSIHLTSKRSARKPDRSPVDPALTLFTPGHVKRCDYINKVTLTATFFISFSVSTPLMLINLSNGVAGSCYLEFLIKIAGYNPLVALLCLGCDAEWY